MPSGDVPEFPTGHTVRHAFASAIILLLGCAVGVSTASGREGRDIAASAVRTATAAADAEAQPGRARVLFVGDMFFDRFIRQKSDRVGADFPFSCIDPLLRSADMVVGNLEGPITDNGSISVGTVPGSPNNYRFTFPKATAALLLRHNVKAVSIGNNHILNFGHEGLAQPIAFSMKPAWAISVGLPRRARLPH